MKAERIKGTLLLALPTVLLISLALSLSSAGPASAVPVDLASHVPIHIFGDGNFTPANGVIGGSGTESDPYIIENWSIDASTAHGIWIENTKAHFIIRNCLVENGRGNYHYYRGTYLDNVMNGRIENNACSNNYFGIQLYYSPRNTLSNNICLNNDQGIRLDYQSDNNTLSHNTCENNREIGILLGCSRVKMRNNTLSNNQYNFGVLGSYITDFDHDIDESNLVNGKPIRYLVGHSNEIIGPSLEIGYLGLVNCDNIQVENLTLGNNVDGILLAFTENSQIKNCAIENNSLGIRLVFSVNNTLSHNTCENNYYYGIWICFSDNNRICHNNLENNVSEGIGLFPFSSYNTLDNNTCLKNNVGIGLSSSDNNTLSHNTCENNSVGVDLAASGNVKMRNNTISNNQYNFAVWGDLDKFFIHDINESNLVNGKPIRYLVGHSDEVIGSSIDVGYLGLANCSNILVENLTLGNNLDGILLAFTDNSRVKNCIIKNNKFGIHLFSSSNNTLDSNTCENNYYGIWFENSDSNTLSTNTCRNSDELGITIYSSKNNYIYHNNFMNNAHQARDNGTNYWDDGYPSGGNYWSDYTGVDNYGGENQDIPGSDGIGDTLYNIPGDSNQDRYPLMSPVGLRTEVRRTVYSIADVYAFGEYLKGYSRSQLKFDISSIPTGAAIVSAKLWLYRFAADNWDGNITLYRVENQAWDETITASEFDAQILADEENHVSKFMSQGWDYLDVLNQLESDYDNNTYTSFRLKWINDNESEPSVGVDDGRFLFINSEANELSISFCASEYDGRDPYLEVIYVPPHAVSVSILPTYQSGKPGKELSYSVMVANMGNLDDNYVLTVGDNAGWGPTLLDNLLEIPAGENRQTTLSVTVPANALGCTNDNIIVTVTSQTDNTVSDNDSCIAHAEIVRDVQVSISPTYQENLPGENLIYEITVRNTGNIADIYALKNSDSLGWPLGLENKSLAIPPFENRTTKLTATIPENAIPCTDDNILVVATSQENENVSAQDTCIAHAQAVRGVEVSIWPSYQSGTPGATINYTVTVKNTGNARGDYGLENGDDLGWTLVLSQDLLENIQPNENKTVTLSVTIPDNAAGCTIDNVWVTATSTENENVRDNENCQAHAAVVRSVDVSISPSEDSGVPGSTLTYTITVKNTGNVLDNYNLTVGDNENWGPSLSENRLKNVEPGENEDVTLSVIIPDNAVPCMVDNITITATSQADNTVSASASCIAHAIAAPPPPPPTNEPPTADADGPYTVQENGTVELDGTGSTDPDGDPLTYSWTIVDDPTSGAGLINDDTATPVFHAPGHVDSAVDVTVKLSVNDGHGHTDSDTATVTVQPAGVNLPPTADADGPYWAQENETVELDGTGSSDSDGTIVVYSWTITDDPTGEVLLTDPSTATPVFHAPPVESDTDVTVKLTVEDDDGATDTDTATVTVRAVGEGPPQYELSTSVSPSEGGTVTLNPPGGIYEEGTEVTLTAEPADNYEFDHWSGDASGTSTSVTITMDSDKSVTAHFMSIEEEEGLPLIQLGVGIILIIIIIAIVTAIASRRRTASRRR